MDERTMSTYLRIIEGFQMPLYKSAEEQGREIQRCTILEDANFSYSNYTTLEVPMEESPLQ